MWTWRRPRPSLRLARTWSSRTTAPADSAAAAFTTRACRPWTVSASDPRHPVHIFTHCTQEGGKACVKLALKGCAYSFSCVISLQAECSCIFVHTLQRWIPLCPGQLNEHHFSSSGSYWSGCLSFWKRFLMFPSLNSSTLYKWSTNNSVSPLKVSIQTGTLAKLSHFQEVTSQSSPAFDRQRTDES